MTQRVYGEDVYRRARKLLGVGIAHQFTEDDQWWLEEFEGEVLLCVSNNLKEPLFKE